MFHNKCMEISVRKQRDLHQREALFLDRAKVFLLKDGYHGLTMDRIAKATGYSRGTIYQHFCSKEDIIVALLNRAMQQRLVMIERGATFRGCPRERMQAIGEGVQLFRSLYADDAQMFHLGNAESILQRASSTAVNAMKECLRKTIRIAVGIVNDAIDVGDLVLYPPATPELLTVNLLAITEVGHHLETTWTLLSEWGLSHLNDAMVNGCERLCDGYGWRPLSSEFDFEAIRQRVRREIYPEEMKKLENLQNGFQVGIDWLLS
jgi:AcrR family transcriptional regulator